VEAEGFAAAEGGDGDDVPDVVGDEPGGEEMYIAGGVGTFDVTAAAGVDLVGVAARMGGRLDLDAEEAAPGVEDDVVGSGVAVGLHGDETESGGSIEEGEFGEGSLLFG
jgi:hypothetical protein